MTHPAIVELSREFQDAEIHAARSGREVMRTLTRVALDSKAVDAASLLVEMQQAVDALLESMLPYAPPVNVIHRFLAYLEDAAAEDRPAAMLRQEIEELAAAFEDWSRQARNLVSQHGASLIPSGGAVYTFTLSETVLNTFRTAWQQGRSFHVLLTESRPNEDGLDTAEKLSQMGVPVSISIDAALATVVPHADIMIVGAEAIMVDGSAVCKVGTYPSALVAHRFGVPVYVIVDTLKFNSASMVGLSLATQRMTTDDVLSGGFSSRVQVLGQLFDRTPGELIRGIVTEKGIVSPAAAADIIRTSPLSPWFNQRLAAWARRTRN